MPEPDPSAATRTPSEATSPFRPLPGGSPPFPVPDHTLIRRVGRGAYGEVWLARNALGTWRAVKFVRRSAFDDDRPFEREFAGIQRFEPISRSHESQLNILHVGRAEDGFYYVMELADDMGDALPGDAGFPTGELQPGSTPTGKSALQPDTYTPRNLRSELHLRGRLPAAECLRIGLALTTALEHLHRHGLVHRDIKPSNIVFVNGIPKLADIGLVARAEATISFVGTEGFLPPEGPGTRPADIYSLGKVLYEISTGHDRQQFPELPTNIVELPDRAELSELNEVLLKACHRDPQERYQTASEMHADLALLESGRSVVRMRGIEKRLRIVQRAGAVVTIFGALAVGLYLWQARQTKIVRELANQNRQIAEEKTRLAAEKSSLAEENHQRIVRLDVANGVRLLDDGDPAGALLWFADALTLVTNNPAEESIHRIRLQQALEHFPRLVNVFPHPANVQCVVLSPDEKQITTACDDGFVRIWDATQNDQPLREYRQPFPPRRVRYTRDGRRLLVVTAPTWLWYPPPLNLTVLDAATGTAAFPALTNLTACAASPDDQWLAVAETNFTVRIYKLATGHLAGVMPGHEDFVSEINFSPDSRQIITASFDRTARRWQVPSGKSVGPPLRHDSALGHAVFSPDGQRLATSASTDQADGRVEFQTWDAATGVAVGKPTQAKDDILVLGFDRRSRRLFAGDRQYRVQVCDASTGEALPSLKLASYACSFDRSPDDGRIAVGADDGSVSIWDIERGRSLGPPLFHYARVQSVQFDQTGQRLLTASGDGTVKLWNLMPPQPARTLQLDGEWPRVEPGAIRPSFGREAGPLQIPLVDGTVRLIDPDSLRELHRLVPTRSKKPSYNSEAAPNGRHWQVTGGGIMDLFSESTDGTIRRVALNPSGGAFGGLFSRDSSRLFTCGEDGTIRLWSTLEGRLERSIRIPEPFTEAVSCDLDAQRAFLSGPDGVHQWFDLASETRYGAPFRLPSVWISRIDPSGERIAIVGRDQTVQVWKVRTGEPASPVFKHAGTGIYLDWSPDGRRLVTAGLSAEARIWDAATGEQLLSSLVLSREPVRAARWSLDGRFIVTRSDDQPVRVWDAATAEPVTPKLRQESYVRFACLRANNRLLIACDPNFIRTWDIAETRLPPDVIADYARLVSGRRLNAAGVMVPLKPEELAELSRSLHARAPQLFE